MTTETSVPPARLLGWDCIEFWVGNARAFAGFLMSAFGFSCTAYAGPESGVRAKASYVLEQGAIRFVISGALDADSAIAAHVRTHGDGVHDLAWLVDDAEVAYRAAMARGARNVRGPWTEADAHGVLSLATIATYGETQHTFVDRSRYAGTLLEPGYHTENLPPPPVGPIVGLTAIDHVVGNVEQGRLADWVRFYAEVMGFDELQNFREDQISTEYSALMSTVVWDGSKIVMPLNEPADGRRKSQIQEYVDTYDGAGVQHIALRTDNIVATVQAMRERGVRFMRVPDTYYRDAQERVGAAELPWDELQRLHILVDRDRDGLLLQIFTETVTDRPTVFFEIIERRGARGFGEGNFRALFEAIERYEARRQSLRSPVHIVEQSWVPVPEDSDFTLANLPFGTIEFPSGDRSVAIRIGDHTIDLARLQTTALGSLSLPDHLFAARSLNAFMAAGPEAWSTTRDRVRELLTAADARPLVEQALLALDEVRVVMPVEVGDFVDFYSSIHHATNLGRLFRPGGDPLLANWRHLPVGYHGRGGTCVLSGTPVQRPYGLIPGDEGGTPTLRATKELDFELEVGFVVGVGGTRLAPDAAAAHVFGAVLVNDWSACDIQAFEYQPLGPFLGKSFATTISPWIVPLDALGPYCTDVPVQQPEPAPYLRATRQWALDLDLAVELNGERISATNFRHQYWTFAQQLAHMTVNGATTRPGDLFASGAVSGPTPDEYGSLIELTARGERPIRFLDGTHRAFLADGDTVTLRGSCGEGPMRVGFGECTGTIEPGM